MTTTSSIGSSSSISTSSIGSSISISSSISTSISIRSIARICVTTSSISIIIINLISVHQRHHH